MRYHQYNYYQDNTATRNSPRLRRASSFTYLCLARHSSYCRLRLACHLPLLPASLPAGACLADSRDAPAIRAWTLTASVSRATC